MGIIRRFRKIGIDQISTAFAKIIAGVNGFNLKYKIKDNKNEIVYRGEN